MKNRKSTLLVRPFLVLALLCSAIAGNQAYALTKISSISGEIMVESDIGPYTQVAVKCVSKKEKLFLRKNPDSRQWCDLTLGQFCDSSKVAAALKLCDRKYTSALRKANTNDAPATVSLTKPATAVKNSSKPTSVANTDSQRSVESLEQEKFEIQQKTLEIEARKLELRRQELALRKQQLALSNN